MPSPTFCSNFTCSFKSSDPCLIGQATWYNLCLLQTTALHVLRKSYLPWYMPMVLFLAHQHIWKYHCQGSYALCLAQGCWTKLWKETRGSLSLAPLSIHCPQLLHLHLLLVVMPDVLHCLHPISSQLPSPQQSIAQWNVSWGRAIGQDMRDTEYSYQRLGGAAGLWFLRAHQHLSSGADQKYKMSSLHVRPVSTERASGRNFSKLTPFHKSKSI